MVAVAALFAGCCHNVREAQTPAASAAVAETAVADTAATMPASIPAAAPTRRPDVVVHGGSGHTLTLQTRGLRLTAPGDAVRRDADYSVTSLPEGELPPLPQEMVNLTAAAAGYRLLPGGEHFKPCAELRVAYNPALLPQGYTPYDIYTSYYDTASGTWVRLERTAVDTASCEIVSLTSHFTDFVNELLKAPEMPETQALVPTAMNDLEAVGPMDGLPQIAPPAANNNGTANLSYPLVLPAGRGGMQPVLELAYSSGGGGGWLGAGWDIALPSITLDTRWGVPRYDQSHESEIYLYNGEQLVAVDGGGVPFPMPHRTNRPVPRHAAGARFVTRTGDAHDSIVRHGTSPSNYWWEVVDRTGTTHYYGHYADASRQGLPATLCDDKGNIARWALTESRDLHGNAVRYYYDLATAPVAGVSAGRQLYPDSIRYTGHGADDGHYTVVFCRTAKNTPDIPVSCNLGFKEVTAQRLDNVQLRMGDSIITAWLFETENGYHSNYKDRLAAVAKVDSAEGGLRSFMAQRCHCIRPWEDDCERTLDVKEKELYNPITHTTVLVKDSIWHSVCNDAWESSGTMPLGSMSGGYAGSVQYFEYYNAPEPEHLFSAPVLSNSDQIPSENLHGHMPSVPFGQHPVSQATALGLTHSTSWSVGGTAALGFGAIVCLSSASVGGNYTRSGSSSESLMTLVDLDGDGLADKVYIRNGRMYFCRHKIYRDSIISFDPPEEIAGAPHFMRESSRSNTFGVQLSVGFSGSASWTNSKSTTPTYFADVNGDGLVDIVDDGQVFFNRLVGGLPGFSPYSDIPATPEGNGPDIAPAEGASACGGIIFDGGVDDSITCRRVWVQDAQATCSLDLAELYVQHYQGNPDTMATYEEMAEEPGFATVRRYHREWDCSYRDDAPGTEAVRVWVAPRSGTIRLQSAVWLLNLGGRDRDVARHADGIDFTIQHSGDITVAAGRLHSSSDRILRKGTVCATCYYPHQVAYDSAFKVSAGDLLFFRLGSRNNHSFDDIEGSHTITYLDGDGETFNSDYDYVLSGDHCFQAPVPGNYYIICEYNEPGGFELDIAANGSTDTYTYSQVVHKTGWIDRDSTICFTVRATASNANWGGVFCRPRVFFYPDTNYTRSDITANGVVDIRITDTLEGYIPCRMAVEHGAASPYNVPLLRRLFGPLYKGWGQFAYHALDTGAAAAFIRPDTLVPPDMLVPGLATAADTVGLRDSLHRGDNMTAGDLSADTSMEAFQSRHSLYYPLSFKSRWVEMTPDVENYSWVSYGRQNSVDRHFMRNSLQTDWYTNWSSAPAQCPDIDEPEETVYDDPVPASYSGTTPAKAIRKTNSSKGFSWSLGYSGAGVSGSSGGNTIEADYLDLNGDRYPDNVGFDRVQYSQQWGGIGPVRNLPPYFGSFNGSANSSMGMSYSASQITQRRLLTSVQGRALFQICDEGSGNLSTGGNVGRDRANGMWTDMNGDGLPDFATDAGLVFLNTGYSFLPAELWNFTEPHRGVSASISAGASAAASTAHTMLNLADGHFNVWQGSIQAGASIGGSYSQTEATLADINGDGLPDKVYRGFPDIQSIVDNRSLVGTFVEFNLGNGMWSQPWQLDIGNFHASTTYSESLNAGLTYGFTFWGAFKATVGVDASPHSSSVCRDHVQLVDVNADGLPDLVRSDDEGSLSVRYNRGGRTNLLHSVTGPAGAGFEIAYTLSAPDYDQPSRAWLMSQVETYDPLNAYNGPVNTVTRYSYAEPRYDRYERTSYGYKQVIASQVDPAPDTVYRRTLREYYSGMLRRGRLRRELTYFNDQKWYIEKEHNCTYTDYTHGTLLNPDDECPAMAYPSEEFTVTRYYEGGTVPLLTVGERVVYDRYHNVVLYEDHGDLADPGDGLFASFSYHTGLPNNLTGLRTAYRLYEMGSNTLLRGADYVYNLTDGSLLRQKLLADTGTADYDFAYDQLYGNLTVATLPENLEHQRMQYTYTYDNLLQTHPASITNSFGETLSTAYDYRFGKPTRVTYPGGASMTYRYDFAGRLVSVRSPLDTLATPTLVHQYHPAGYYHNGIGPAGYAYSPSPSGHPYSVSLHYDDGGGLVTATAVLSNGFGRPVQSKKGLRTGGSDMMLVSGRTVADAFGRTVQQYDPVVEPVATHIGLYNTNFDPLSLATTSYDILDRVTETRLPLGVTTSSAYSIDADQQGRNCFLTVTTDPNGGTTRSYADYEGRRVQLTDHYSSNTLLIYDNLGQLISSTDPEGFTTTYSYDMLGRLASRIHPDAGQFLFSYDDAGNLRSESTPLGQTLYTYHYSRPLQKQYSQMPANNAAYTYGTSGNDIGRVVLITDGSGAYECSYDAMGNVAHEVRTIAVPGNSDEVYSFAMHYRYDSWGRILSIVYPDSEAVNYSYQWGGDLLSMQGTKAGVTKQYIQSIEYDPFGQRSLVRYGNNTVTSYAYDMLHRLTSLSTVDAGLNTLQSIAYTHDYSGNIVQTANVSGSVGGLGGYYTCEHSYDALHRLTESESSGALGSYFLQWSYSPSGRLAYRHRYSTSSSQQVDAQLAYGYCDYLQPHAVRAIYDSRNLLHYDLRWDDAGNLGQLSVAGDDMACRASRFLYWTEDCRLHTVADDRHYSYYAYDNGGERRLKLTAEKSVSRVDINADLDWSTTYMTLDNLTLYPSPYLVMTRHGYTKHYYAGSERVAASLGSGGIRGIYGDNSQCQLTADNLYLQSRANVSSRVLTPTSCNSLTALGGYGYELQRNMYDIPPTPGYAGITTDVSGFVAAARRAETASNTGEEVYFYHSDHLGSASWITDGTGSAIQHLQYLPYGEEFVNQRTAGYQERYTFTGKEKDAETGYGYFGARYMDHELMTMWLSVDPMADKYPGISPYAYCAWNPVKLVDPDGRFPIKTHKEIVSTALSNTTIAPSVQKKILYGVGTHSDVWNASKSAVHLDNMRGFESIKEHYLNAVNGFNSNMQAGNYVTAGENLHTIADFYSHSNYIDLYSQYASENGLSMAIDDIPTFFDAMNNTDFVDYANSHGGFQTGSFSIGGWLMETVFKKPPLEESHTLMNLDSEVSINGGKPYNVGQSDSPSKHAAARAVAQKETNKLVKQADAL